jgi:hypothetical protein
MVTENDWPTRISEMAVKAATFAGGMPSRA